MNKEKILSIVYARYKLFRFLTWIYNHVQLKNRLHSKGCKLSTGVSMLNGLKIINHGKNNEITIGDFVRIKSSTIILHGDHNKIVIGDFAYLNAVELYTENAGNEITIGKHTSLCGRSHFATIEGTKIAIGDDCLFSSDIHFRTGDSHSVVDLDGKRINPSKDIIIEDHVWVGTKVTCLKGVHVAENSIVAATTTLCKKYDQPNVVIGGVPGEIIKTGINWKKERMPVEQ